MSFSQLPGDSVTNSGNEEWTPDDLDASSSVDVLPLGSGGEVGRSCVIVTHRGKRVMFDCGIHPARHGIDSLPLFDVIDLATIDAVLITHFHLDHCGALPYLCSQTNFRGRVFMTHPTKAFYRMVLQDYAKVSPNAYEIVNDEWLTATLARVETIDYHESIRCGSGIRFHAYNAGHVLGAAMFFVELRGATVLYTGDYSRTPDRHLLGAETPLYSPDILIVESTYGIVNHEPREEREAKFLDWVVTVVQRGGRCLVPVFALGRAQELLLILEEYWESHPELHRIPLYYISSMSKRCMQLYATYGNAMNERVKRRARNPFHFTHITCLKDLRSFSDDGPCVVLASPGMLQTGVSRELFERWCGDRRNGVIIAGYCVDGTLAKEVTTKPKEIMREDGLRMLPLRMGTIGTVSFSAHSDFQQTRDFLMDIPEVKSIVLVHGNYDAMKKLADRLRGERDTGPTSTLSPVQVHETANGRNISILVEPRYYASIMGRLAAEARLWWTHAKQNNAGVSSVEGGVLLDTQVISRRAQFSLDGSTPADSGLFIRTLKTSREVVEQEETPSPKEDSGAMHPEYTVASFPVHGVLVETDSQSQKKLSSLGQPLGREDIGDHDIPIILAREDLRSYANIPCYDRLMCGVHLPMRRYQSIMRIYAYLTRMFQECVLVSGSQEKGLDSAEAEKVSCRATGTAGDVPEADVPATYPPINHFYVIRIAGFVRVALQEGALGDAHGSTALEPRSDRDDDEYTHPYGAPLSGSGAAAQETMGGAAASSSGMMMPTLFVSWPMHARLDVVGDAVCIALVHYLSKDAEEKDHQGGGGPNTATMETEHRVDERAVVGTYDDDLPTPTRHNLSERERDEIFRARAAHSFLCQHFSGVYLHLARPRPRPPSRGPATVVVATSSPWASNPTAMIPNAKGSSRCSEEGVDDGIGEGDTPIIVLRHLGILFRIDALTLHVLSTREPSTSGIMTTVAKHVPHPMRLEDTVNASNDVSPPQKDDQNNVKQAQTDVERVLKRMGLAMFPIALLDGDGLCECPPCVTSTKAIF